MTSGKVECFRRFRLEDAEAAHEEIAACREKLDAAHAEGDEEAELAARIRLGFLLTPLDREAEAIAALEPAVALARKRGEPMAELEALLNLATALQYLGERERAQALFQDGLDRAKACEIADFDSFYHHHRGRCCVEQGKLAEARAAFEIALALREQMGVERFIMSSQAALADLDRMEGKD